MNKKIHIYFIISLIVFMVVLLYTVLSYHTTPRMVPLVLLIAGLVLAFLQLLMETSGRVAEKLKFLQKEAALISFENEEVSKTKKDPEKDFDKWQQVFRIFFWLTAYTVVIYFIGLLYSAMLFIFLYSLVESRKKWTYAAGMSLGIGGFMLVVFGYILRAL